MAHIYSLICNKLSKFSTFCATMIIKISVTDINSRLFLLGFRWWCT
nr:MAG TPA: hypothetical protein [Bacteriophage sp.]